MEKISVIIPTARPLTMWQNLVDDLAICDIDELIIVYDSPSTNKMRDSRSLAWQTQTTIPLIIEHSGTNNRLPCANASIVRNI